MEKYLLASAGNIDRMDSLYQVSSIRNLQQKPPRESPLPQPAASLTCMYIFEIAAFLDCQVIVGKWGIQFYYKFLIDEIIMLPINC